MIRFILRPRSAWATPLRADTLYGLMLMRLGEEEGAQAVQDTLEAFRQGKPPFIFSSAMPAHTLPAPCLPPLPRAVFQQKVEQGVFIDAEGKELSLLQALQRYKAYRKRVYIAVEQWLKHAFALSAERLFKDFCAQEEQPTQRFSKAGSEPHVSLCRRSGASLQGGLFHNTLTYFSPDSSFHIYAHVANKEQEQSVLQRIQRIGLLGFGKDASTGKGRFDVELDTDFSPTPFLAQSGTAQLLLSPCASHNMQGIQGYYAADIKRGKAAWHISEGNPFKNPFLCIREGAVLQALPQGSFVLDAVHAHAHIAQVLSPVTLPCTLLEAAHEC